MDSGGSLCTKKRLNITKSVDALDGGEERAMRKTVGNYNSEKKGNIGVRIT